MRKGAFKRFYGTDDRLVVERTKNVLSIFSVAVIAKIDEAKKENNDKIAELSKKLTFSRGKTHKTCNQPCKQRVTRFNLQVLDKQIAIGGIRIYPRKSRRAQLHAIYLA